MNFMAWAPPFVDSVSPPGVDGSAAAGLTAVSGLAGLFLMRPPARLLPEQSLEPLLEGTNLGCPGVELSRAYKGSVDGWSSVNFHRAVDGKGSAIVIAQTTTGAILGGYNAAGWRSSDDYISSTNCFLFSYKGQTLSKYEVIGSGDAAIYDYSKEGPRFGSDALIIGPGQSATMGLFAGPDNEDISFGAGDLREAKASGATMVKCLLNSFLTHLQPHIAQVIVEQKKSRTLTRVFPFLPFHFH
ncbi:unnamed protein product [Chrysoparadoxa australica]